MARVAVVDGVKIFFYAADHAPPHFHALFAAYEALIDIESLELRKGSMPRKKLESVLNWASTRKPQLLAAWLTTQAKRLPDQIP